MLDLHGYGWMLWEGVQVTLLVGVCAMVLALFMWTHLILVSSILISKDAMLRDSRLTVVKVDKPQPPGGSVPPEGFVPPSQS